MQAKQSNASLINIHTVNSHINPENTIITKDFIEKFPTKAVGRPTTPKEEGRITFFILS